MNALKNIIIGSLFVLTQLSGSLYLPSLPVLASHFHVSSTLIILTLTWFFSGYAVGQILWGTLSDYISRKPTIIISLFIYIISTVSIIILHHFYLYVFFMAILGFAAAAYTSVGNALLKDIHGSNVGVAIGYIGIAMACGPMVAPILGSALVVNLGLNAIYIFLGLYALIGLIAISCLVKAPKATPTKDNNEKLSTTIKLIITNGKFLSYVIPLALSFGVTFAYFATAPFIYISYLKLTTIQYGYIMFATTIPYVLGAIYNSIFSKKMSADIIVGVGLTLMIFSTTLLFINSIAMWHNLIILPILFALLMLGTGMNVPAGKTGAMQVFKSHSGKASSMMKFIQTLGCVSITAIASKLHDLHSIVALTILFLAISIISMILFKRLNQTSNT